MSGLCRSTKHASVRDERERSRCGMPQLGATQRQGRLKDDINRSAMGPSATKWLDDPVVEPPVQPVGESLCRRCHVDGDHAQPAAAPCPYRQHDGRKPSAEGQEKSGSAQETGCSVSPGWVRFRLSLAMSLMTELNVHPALSVKTVDGLRV